MTLRHPKNQSILLRIANDNRLILVDIFIEKE